MLTDAVALDSVPRGTYDQRDPIHPSFTISGGSRVLCLLQLRFVVASRRVASRLVLFEPASHRRHVQLWRLDECLEFEMQILTPVISAASAASERLTD